MRITRPIAALLLVNALAGCGRSGGRERPDLLVSAAASLKPALVALERGYGDARLRFSFAGSDALAAQIRSGARPDVYAAANAKLPRALHGEGLVERPIAFARNRLVLAVPATGAAMRSLAGIARPGITLAVGASGVPIGEYTRAVLDGLPPRQRSAILANVRSQEPDVAGIVGKIASGAVDAGFVYVTDVHAAGGRLQAIRLPARLSPEVVYEAAVVRGSRHTAAARRFLATLRGAPVQAALRAAGFLPVQADGR